LCTGQQRPDLFDAAGVVQQDEHPPVGEQAPVQGGLRVEPDRQLLRRDVERLQEAPHRLDGRHRGAARVVPAKVDVQLAVRVLARDAVRPLDRERRLADARRTVDGGDDDGLRRAGGVDQAGQFLQLGRAAGEQPHGRG
jgi:hypothetical protein